MNPSAPLGCVRLDVGDVYRPSRGLPLDGGVRPCRDRRQQELRDREQDGERSSQGRTTSHTPLSAMERCLTLPGWTRAAPLYDA